MDLEGKRKFWVAIASLGAMVVVLGLGMGFGQVTGEQAMDAIQATILAVLGLFVAGNTIENVGKYFGKKKEGGK